MLKILNILVYEIHSEGNLNLIFFGLSKYKNYEFTHLRIDKQESYKRKRK